MKLITNNPDYKNTDSKIHGVEIFSEYIKFDEYPDRQLYFYNDSNFYYISDEISFLQNLSKSEVSKNGLIQLAVFQATLYPYSLYENIISIPLNSILHLKHGNYKFERLSIPDYKEINIDEAIKRLDEVFEKDLENCGDKPYHMYSGGVDSSIVFWHLRNKETTAGSSIYTRTDNSDVSRGIKFFNKFKQNIIHLEPKKYLETLREYKYFNPYICPGTIDDLFHCQAAFDSGCTSIVNGHGSDELMAAYLFEEKNDMKNVNYYMNKYSMLKLKFLTEFFEIETIWDTVENTMAPFDLKTLKGKIMWIMEFHQVPLQLSLMENNSRKVNNIKRFMPFSSRDFFKIVLSLPEDLIANNGIAEYVLRYWARNFLPVNLWAKEKKTFEVDQEKIVNSEPELVKKIFYEKYEYWKKFLKIQNTDKAFQEFQKLFPNEQINFLLYLSQI